jgi:hypothetical protein
VRSKYVLFLVQDFRVSGLKLVARNGPHHFVLEFENSLPQIESYKQALHAENM